MPTALAAADAAYSRIASDCGMIAFERSGTTMPACTLIMAPFLEDRSTELRWVVEVPRYLPGALCSSNLVRSDLSIRYLTGQPYGASVDPSAVRPVRRKCAEVKLPSASLTASTSSAMKACSIAEYQCRLSSP